MRRKLQAKLNSKKGFTLVELLVVVAIIAILVAVSIPMVSGSLDRAREATDEANLRAGRAAALVAYMTDESYNFEAGTEITYYYDAANGTVTKNAEEAEEIVGYNQKKISDAIPPETGIVMIVIHKDGTAEANWGRVTTP